MWKPLFRTLRSEQFSISFANAVHEKEAPAYENGEGYDSTVSTATKTTLTRLGGVDATASIRNNNIPSNTALQEENAKIIERTDEVRKQLEKHSKKYQNLADKRDALEMLDMYQFH